MTRAMQFAAWTAVLVTGVAHADVVVPNSATSTEADGTFSLTATAAAGRTFQFTFAASQLTGIVGQEINGLQWRLGGPGTAAWPAVDTSYAFWDVFIGPGVNPSAMTTTFANNFTGPTTQVRSGPHTFLANSFSFGATPNAFGSTLSFTTPYLYTGGDLAIEMRFAGQVGATNQPAFDALTASLGPGNGWGVDTSARWVSSATGLTGGNANALVTNLVTVPEPSSMAFVGLSLATVAYWKKRRQRVAI